MLVAVAFFEVVLALHILAIVFAFGAAWGVGAITFGLGVEAVGLALGFAVILGVAASAGAIAS